jgi:hypothetical protein
MSQLVKTKRQASFKGFKRFGAFKGLVEQKNVVFNSFVCKLGLFWHSWAFKTRVKRVPTRAKKGPIYTQTRQINYYLMMRLMQKLDKFDTNTQKIDQISKFDST